MYKELNLDKHNESMKLTVDLLSGVLDGLGLAFENHYKWVLGDRATNEVDLNGFNLNIVKLCTEEQLEQEAIDKTKEFILTKADQVNKEVKEFTGRLNGIIDEIKTFRYLGV